MPATRTPASAARSRSTSTGAPRRTLTPREAQALRDALAARQAVAGQSPAGQSRAPQSARTTTTRAATPRTTATRTGTTAGARSTGRTTATGRPTATGRTTARPRTATATGRPAPRRAPAKRTRAAKGRPAVTGPRRWPRRLGIIGFGAVVLPALATVVFSGPVTAPAPGSPEATSLALTARTTLLHDAGRYRQLEQVVSQRRTELAAAQQARRTAETQAADERRVVGAGAASLYRATPTARYPMLALDVADPAATADVLYRQALAERADRALEGAEVRAERAAAAVRTATQRVRDAQAAVTTAAGQAAAALAATRADVHGLSTIVTAQLAALGTSAGNGAQDSRDQQALHRWQGYLTMLADARIAPPPAAELADPADLPAGMSPALDSAHRPIPGVAWAVVGSRPVTVLSAETVAAVSSAFAQVGRPYVAGATGPDSYDCGGFTAASWLLAGYAVPGSPQDQWRTGTPVTARDLQVGDLVFTDGARDVGIYLGSGEVLGASAATFRVAVRSFVAGSPAVRVTLGSSEQPNAALPATPGMGSCGAALPKPGKVSPAWGGYANGRIPQSALCPLGVANHELRCDAAAAYRAMSAAFRSAFGSPLCITDSYRPYTAQIDAYDRKPALAAYPGTSNHGWGLAVDLCGGVNVAGTPQWAWMNANAARFGFVNPDWARPGAEKPEPWHWEYGYLA